MGDNENKHYDVKDIEVITKNIFDKFQKELGSFEERMSNVFISHIDLLKKGFDEFTEHINEKIEEQDQRLDKQEKILDNHTESITHIIKDMSKLEDKIERGGGFRFSTGVKIGIGILFGLVITNLVVGVFMFGKLISLLSN